MRGRLIRRPRISFLLILSVFSQRTEKPKQTAESPLLFVGFPPSVLVSVFAVYYRCGGKDGLCRIAQQRVRRQSGMSRFRVVHGPAVVVLNENFIQRFEISRRARGIAHCAGVVRRPASGRKESRRAPASRTAVRFLPITVVITDNPFLAKNPVFFRSAPTLRIIRVSHGKSMGNTGIRATCEIRIREKENPERRGCRSRKGVYMI